MTTTSDATSSHLPDDETLRRAAADLNLPGFHKERSAMAAEILRLRRVIGDAAGHWLKANLGIPFGGGVDGAMVAAVAEIQHLRRELERVVAANAGFAAQAYANPDVAAREGCFALLRAAGIDDADMGSVHAGIEKLVAQRDEARRAAEQNGKAATERDDRIEQLHQALGLLSTLAPSLVVDLSDPVGMAKRIEAAVRGQTASSQALDSIYEALLAVCNSHGKRPEETFVAFVERIARELYHARVGNAIEPARGPDEELATKSQPGPHLGQFYRCVDGTLAWLVPVPGAAGWDETPSGWIRKGEAIEPARGPSGERGTQMPGGIVAGVGAYLEASPNAKPLPDAPLPTEKDEHGRICVRDPRPKPVPDVPLTESAQEVQTHYSKPGGYSSVALPASKEWPGANAVAGRLETIASGLTYNASICESAAKHWLYELAMLVRGGHTRRPDEERLRHGLFRVQQALNKADGGTGEVDMPRRIDSLRVTIEKLRAENAQVFKERDEAVARCAERDAMVAESQAARCRAEDAQRAAEAATKMIGSALDDIGEPKREQVPAIVDGVAPEGAATPSSTIPLIERVKRLCKKALAAFEDAGRAHLELDREIVFPDKLHRMAVSDRIKFLVGHLHGLLDKSGIGRHALTARIDNDGDWSKPANVQLRRLSDRIMALMCRTDLSPRSPSNCQRAEPKRSKRKGRKKPAAAARRSDRGKKGEAKRPAARR